MLKNFKCFFLLKKELIKIRGKFFDIKISI